MDPKSDKFAQIRLQIKTSPRYCVILILGSICQAALLIVDWFASHKAESLVRPHLENWNLSAEAFASWLLDGARYYYLPGFSFAHNCSTESYYQMFSPLENSSRIYLLSLFILQFSKQTLTWCIYETKTHTLNQVSPISLFFIPYQDSSDYFAAVKCYRVIKRNCQL